MDASAGSRVRQARLVRGVSLRRLASALGVSPATLSAVETGRTGLAVSRLHAIAEALGAPVTELLGRPPRAPLARCGPELPEGTGEHWRTFRPLDLDPVLDAALAAFVETGYHGATVRTIARRAGMSVPGLYHHYASKQEMLVAVLDLTMAELHWRVPQARAEGGSPPVRFALMVEAMALFHTHRRELAFIGASEMRSLEPHSRQRIAALRNDLQYQLDEEVRAAVADGSFRTSNPHAAGRAISTMCTSLPQWFRPEGPLTPEQIATQYARFALALMEAEDGERLQGVVGITGAFE